MLFADNVRISLGPVTDVASVPYGEILSEWRRNEFNPERCRRSLEHLIQGGRIPGRFFDPSAIARGGVCATDSLLFPKLDSKWRLELALDKKVALIDVEPHQIELTAALLRWAFHANSEPDRVSFRKRFAKLAPELVGDLLHLNGAPRSEWPGANDPLPPGIYRREHASLLIRSRTSSVLIDPICVNTSFPNMSLVPRSSLQSDPDAILITHSHGDHWHPASILSRTSSEATPVIVPYVERPNILCLEDFSDSLAKIGQTSLADQWWSTHRIGDIEVDVLPFYGEQPSARGPGAIEGARSWGNCYRVNTPDFSALILVDSGEDPMGKMDEVVERSSKARGPVDVVLSCLRTFHSPFFGGLEGYFVTLPFERLKQLYDQFKGGALPYTTAGPEGAAELCRIAGAKYFLPYAHGFSGVGNPIQDVGWGYGEPSEASLTESMNQVFVARRIPTRALNWNCGDSALFNAREIQIQRIRNSDG